ncbi:AAA family ATPase [Actinomadura sp. 3N508]|uniref:AAA family ATPase n=1 Tax=Actinomadura sp. 3N508 TaxID=3375153 RepID=UPI0037AAA049
MFDLLGSGALAAVAAAAGASAVVVVGHFRRRASAALDGLPELRGEIPSIPEAGFVGREEELARLEQLARLTDVRLISIVGGGGIGKTALVAEFARSALRGGRVYQQVHWSTVRLRPRAADFLADVVLALASRHFELAQTLTGRTDQLTALLKEKQRLLVIDNAESVLVGEGATDAALRQEYSHVLDRIMRTGHRSLVLITSRIPMPPDLRLDRGTRAYRELRLGELQPDDAQELFKRRMSDLLDDPGIAEDPRLATLETQSPRNPLLIELIALQSFSAPEGRLLGVPNFSPRATAGGFKDVVDWYMERLTPLSRSIAFQIALAAEGTDHYQLAETFHPAIEHADIERAVAELEFALGLRRDGLLSFHAVISELLGEVLVAECVTELIEERYDTLRRVLLQDAHASTGQRGANERRILGPILDRLGDLPRSGRQTTEPLVQAIAAARGEPAQSTLASNVVTLLLLREERCQDLDLSGLMFRKVDFTQAELHRCDFAGSTFVDCRFTSPHGTILAFAWSPDDRQLVGVDALGNLLQWQGHGLREMATARISRSWLRAAQIMANGLVVAGGDDSELIVVDPASMEVVGRTREEGMFWIRAVDGFDSVYTGSEDGDVRRWTLGATGLGRDTSWSLDGGAIRAVRAFGKSAVVAGCDDGSIAVLNEKELPAHRIRIGTLRVRGLDVHRDRPLIAVALDDVGLWVGDLSTRSSTTTGPLDMGSVHALTWTSGRYAVLTAGDDGVIWEWPVRERKGRGLSIGEPRVVTVLSSRVLSLNLANDGDALAVSCQGESAYLVDLPQARARALSNGCTRRIWSLSLSPDGRQMACGSEDRLVHVWRLDERGRTMEAGSLRHNGRVWRVCHSRTGKEIVTACDDNLVRIWDAESLRLKAEMVGHRDWVLDVRTYSKDGIEYILSTSNDRRIGVWTLEGERVGWRTHHRARVLRVTEVRDGLAVSSSSDERLVLFHPISGEIIEQGGRPGHRAWGLDYSPRYNEIATGGDDGLVCVWDLQRGLRDPLVIGEVPDTVLEVRYCLDGELLIVGSLIEDGLRAFRRSGSRWRPAEFLEQGHRVRAIQELESASLLLAAGADETIIMYSLPDLSLVDASRLTPFYTGCSFARAQNLTSGQRAALQALGAEVD